MQVVGYDAGVGTDDQPALLLSGAGNGDRDEVGNGDVNDPGGTEVRREPLVPGRELAYTLGERQCAGTLDGTTHHACDAPDAPYCEVHASRWPCARCTGECSLPLPACREEHAVYLAAFAPATFKVGVTRSWRLCTRLREQGADRGAHLRTVSNGRLAREIEAGIAAEVGDSVRVPTKVEGFHRSVDDGAWRDLLSGFDAIETYEFDYGLELTDQPVAETLATGTVRGTKGRVLVLDAGGGTYAVDMRDLVGYELREGATDRDLQSSLGAFG